MQKMYTDVLVVVVWEHDYHVRGHGFKSVNVNLGVHFGTLSFEGACSLRIERVVESAPSLPLRRSSLYSPFVKQRN
jgi:hypothetical protein